MESLVSAYIYPSPVTDFSSLVTSLLRLVKGEGIRVEYNKFKYCIMCIVL